MRKNVEYYKVCYNFFPLDSVNHTNDELKDIFISEIIKSLDAQEDNIIEIDKTDDSSVIIEKLDHNKNYLFGILGKLEDLEGGLLKRLRHKDDLTEITDETDKPKYFLENFTYFIFRFRDMQCTVLGNGSAPRFRTHFTNFLKNITKNLNHCAQTSGLKNLNVVCIYDDNIPYKLNNTDKLTEINMIFQDSSTVGNALLDLSTSFNISQSDLKRARVYINLNMSAISDETREMLKNDDLIKSNFEKLELKGEDLENQEVQIELVEKLLLKNISIEIDEKYLRSTEDLNKIKEALLGSLYPI